MIKTDFAYDYEALKEDLKYLKSQYSFIKIGSIGKSILNRDLFYIKIGNGTNNILFNASHHGLEWITSLLLMKFTEDYLIYYTNGEYFYNINLNKLYKNCSIYIVPMVNPDGVDIVINGVKKNHKFYDNLMNWSNGSDFSKTWQANARGVDLNHNYDAGWEKSKAAECEYGINGPGPTRFSGVAPESEPESCALANFTRSIPFSIALAFHSQGKCIYWNYENIYPLNSKKIGLILAKASGYTLEETTGIASYSGYKDWFIKEFCLPAYTIEVGEGINPLPLSQFSEIYENMVQLMLAAGNLQ